jgi:two-component system response regulator YesN
MVCSYWDSVPGWDAWSLFQEDVFVTVLCQNSPTGASPVALSQQLISRIKDIHPLSIAVSQDLHGMGGLNDGYYQMLEVLGVLDMQDRQNVVLSYAQLDADTFQHMDTTFERDRRLISSVLEGNLTETQAALSQMEYSGALYGRNTLMLEKRRLLGLVNQMTAELTAHGDVDFLSELDAFRKIMDAPAAKQLSSTFSHVVLGLCDYFSRAQTDLNASRVHRIADYMDRHYADSSLSIDALSETFHISPSYLSRIFKRETGLGVLAYLQAQRMEQAKLLLRSTSLRIRDIAVRVGYVSDQTFTRTFKNATGLTPSAYREQA